MAMGAVDGWNRQNTILTVPYTIDYNESTNNWHTTHGSMYIMDHVHVLLFFLK